MEKYYIQITLGHDPVECCRVIILIIQKNRTSLEVHFFKPMESVKIDEGDIIYETLRSSGPGGQNVNKVETAVRAIHLSTGLSVLASYMRAQIQNKKLAREKLVMKLSVIEEEKMLAQNRSIWINHNMLERGNPIKTFKGDL